MGFVASTMQLTSPAFAPEGRMPAEHSGEGANTSPPLAWSQVPEGTRSFALVNVDPDAPLVADGAFGLPHWVLYNIPGSVRSLPAGVTGYTTGPGGTGQSSYIGPLPPPGHGVHHYYFVLFALSAEPNLEAGLSMSQLLERIEPVTLDMNRLVGTYERN